MAELVFWQNGDSGKTVQQAIETSFKYINDQLNRVSNVYVLDFKTSDWNDGKIIIGYSEHLKLNPSVDLYVKNGNGYSLVYGGYEITSGDIELQSDLAYEGRVVIR